MAAAITTTMSRPTKATMTTTMMGRTITTRSGRRTKATTTTTTRKRNRAVNNEAASFFDALYRPAVIWSISRMTNGATAVAVSIDEFMSGRQLPQEGRLPR